MGKMAVITTFLLLSVFGMAFILTFHPELGRAGAQGSLCATTQYASDEDCVLPSCYNYCTEQASLQEMGFGNVTCSSGGLCQCFCTPGTRCASTKYWQGCTEGPGGGCYEYCQDQAELQGLSYGGSFCLPDDICTCYCKGANSQNANYNAAAAII